MKNFTLLLLLLYGVGLFAQLNEGFENTNFPPPGWASFRGTNDLGTNYDWVRSTSSPNTGLAHAYVRFENVTGGLAEDWLVTPQLAISAGNNTLDFYIRDSYGSDYGSVLYIKYATASQTTHADFTDIISYTESDMSTTYGQKTINLSLYNGQNIFIAFVWEQDDGDNLFLDDVAGPPLYNPPVPPNCAYLNSPLDLSTNIPVDVSFNWSYGGGPLPTGYGVAISTTNPPPYSSIVDAGNVTTYTPLFNLNYNQTYYWQVVPYNAIGPMYGCEIRSFTTGDDPTITTFPSCESFDNPFFPPNGWINEKTGGPDDPGTWDRQTAGINPTCTPHTGAGMARYDCWSYYSGTQGNLVTPPINFPNDDHKVTFWLYRDGSEYLSHADLVNVYYNTSPNTFGAILLGTVNRSIQLLPVVTLEGWYQYEFNMPSGAGGNDRYVIFEGVSAYGNNLFLDDICIEEILPVPPNPATIVYPTDLETDVLATATLNWQAGGGSPTGYNLFFGTDNPPTNLVNGTNLGSATTYDPSGNLEYDQTYYWQIVPYNPHGSASPCPVWSFTTYVCTPVSSFPFIEDFNSGVVPELCWVEIELNSSENWHHDSYTNSAFCSGGDYPQDEWLISPVFDFSSEVSPVLTFKWNALYDEMVSPNNRADYYCKISTDDGATWAELWSEEDEGYFDWSFYKTKIIDLSDYAGSSNVKIAFQFLSFETIANGAFLEDFTITSDPLVMLQPLPWWQTINGSFAAGNEKMYSVPLVANLLYNFSICDNDGVGASFTGAGNGDLSLYSDASLSTLVWTIDGESGCSYNASTLGTSHENFTPTLTQDYYLVVHDHDGTNAGSFTFAFQGNFIEIQPIYGTCQSTLIPDFEANSGVYCKMVLDDEHQYNFSTCNLDICPGEALANDADFHFYNSYGTLDWYRDGPSSCGYDATTYGSIYENYTPPNDGVYFLYIDDYYNAPGSAITLAYSYLGPYSILSDLTYCYGDQVYVPVTVQKFENIGGISLTLNYDPAILTYADVSLHTDISSALTFIPSPGEFRIAWTEGTGIGLADDEVLFTLEFDYIGPSTGGTTNLTWPELPEELNEYSDPQGNVFIKDPFGDFFVDGTVTIQEQPTIEAGPDQYVCADVVSVTMAGYSYTGATGADWSGGAGSWAGDVYSPTSGETASGSVVLTYTTNTADPCPEISDFMTVYFYPLPELSSVTLQASTEIPGPPWDYLVSGDIGGGYSMCITPGIDYFFLDINTLVSSPALAADILNPFSLNTTSLPTNWWTYWALKGVDGGGPYLDWRDQMWQIINGWSPFFYIKYSSGTDYKLVDGLQYFLYGGEPVLTVPGDYPNHNYTYDGTVTDINGCISLPIPVMMDFHTCDISGALVYNNSAQTGLNNMTVMLNSTPSVSATTGTDGSYTLSNVQSGTHTITFNDNGLTIGGINATDAAQVNYWGTSPWSIEKVRFFAGDATLTNYLDANDASRILSYFVNAGTPAMSPTWKFWLAGDMIGANPYAGPANPSVTVLSTSVTQGLYGLCTGDFNQSFTPGLTKSASESLLLVEGKNIYAPVGTELELPIVAGTDMDLGAVSLILNFPSDKLEISEVFLTSDPSSSLMYNISGDELRIGWNSLIPVYLNEGESLITLKMKVIDESGVEGISLSLVADPLNELANDNFLVIDNAILVMDVIHTSALGIENNVADNLELANHPNPFNESTTFTYGIPTNGKVTLEVYDLLGNKVIVLVNEMEEAGNHQVILNSGLLMPGVYMANLKLDSRNDVSYKTIRIISR